jgi:hypothetical protein
MSTALAFAPFHIPLVSLSFCRSLLFPLRFQIPPPPHSRHSFLLHFLHFSRLHSLFNSSTLLLHSTPTKLIRTLSLTHTHTRSLSHSLAYISSIPTFMHQAKTYVSQLSCATSHQSLCPCIPFQSNLSPWLQNNCIRPLLSSSLLYPSS